MANHQVLDRPICTGRTRGVSGRKRSRDLSCLRGSWHGWRPVYALADRFAVSPTAMVI